MASSLADKNSYLIDLIGKMIRIHRAAAAPIALLFLMSPPSRAVRLRVPALHFKSGNQLVLKAKPDKPIYLEGDAIGVDVTIKNRSVGTIRAIVPRIYFCAADSRSTIKIDAYDVKNPHAAIGQYCPYLNDAFELGSPAALLEHTVVLLPGQKYRVRVLLQQTASQMNAMSCDFEERNNGKYVAIGNRLPIGRYRIRIMYAPDFNYYWGHLMQSRYGDIWTGTLVASEFDLDIRPRR